MSAWATFSFRLGAQAARVGPRNRARAGRWVGVDWLAGLSLAERERERARAGRPAERGWGVDPGGQEAEQSGASQQASERSTSHHRADRAGETSRGAGRAGWLAGNARHPALPCLAVTRVRRRGEGSPAGPRHGSATLTRLRSSPSLPSAGQAGQGQAAARFRCPPLSLPACPPVLSSALPSPSELRPALARPGAELRLPLSSLCLVTNPTG